MDDEMVAVKLQFGDFPPETMSSSLAELPPEAENDSMSVAQQTPNKNQTTREQQRSPAKEFQKFRSSA